MKKNGLSFWSLMLITALLITSSTWLLAGDTSSDPADIVSQQAAIAGNPDIVQVEITYGTAAASTKVSGYKLTGVKWKVLPVTFAFNSENQNSGLSESDVKSILAASAETWDTETNANLYASQVANTNTKYGVYNGTNTLAFDNLGAGGTIAVTMYWYNRKTREILEFDMCFNTYYDWGDAENTEQPVMDIQNIATHEFGHTIGLGDLYQSVYSELTMYGYADFDQINKRSLEPADVAGLEKLYGP